MCALVGSRCCAVVCCSILFSLFVGVFVDVAPSACVALVWCASQFSEHLCFGIVWFRVLRSTYVSACGFVCLLLWSLAFWCCMPGGSCFS